MSRSGKRFSYVRDFLQPDIGVVLFVLAFFSAFFARVILQNRFILTGDGFYYTYPMRTIAWQTIADGALPLWTPLILSGYPLIAVGQLALGYPFTWTYLLLPSYWAEQIYVLTPFLLSPLTTYAYCRGIGRSRLASLLAGLSFGYGGMMCGILANSGMLTNTLLWSPLVLLFVDRARTRSFAHCLCWAGSSYALSVLAGHAQSYVYVGILTVAYGLFTSFVVRIRETHTVAAWKTWRPFVVAISAIGLGAGVAAFQLLETLRAARQSIRSTLPYEVFAEASFSFREALLSLGAQIYHYVDSGTYVTPLSLLLAAITLISVVRQQSYDERIWFWLMVAAVSWILLLGSNTPVHPLLYHVPIINKFRAHSRHTFEWTLSVSILAAYGWDFLTHYLSTRSTRTIAVTRHKPLAAVALVLIAAFVGLNFWSAVAGQPELQPPIHTSLPERTYWIWKISFAAILCAATWLSLQVFHGTIREILLVTAIFLACFVEAHATASCWWTGSVSLPAERFQSISSTTRYLQQFSPERNRVYTRVGMYSDEFRSSPRVDAPNLTMLWNLQNVAGLEPLIFERYSRALGDVGPDSVTPRIGTLARNGLFSESSNVLNLLNTTHVVTFSGALGFYEETLVHHDGVGLSVAELNTSLPPGATTIFANKETRADQIGFVTSLANSVSESDGTPVARIRLFTNEGRIIDRQLIAGRDTAEWAYERPDVRAAIKHRLATVFDSREADAKNTFRANRYWSLLKLEAVETIQRIEITNLSQFATFTIWKASLHESATQRSVPLTANIRSRAWRVVYEDGGVEVLKNDAALPRVWLVNEAQAVQPEEALRRIRGESSVKFDPRRTVLLEIDDDELPPLPGTTLSAGEAQILDYQPTRLTINTSAATDTMLIVSEIYYPGWKAKIDGNPAHLMVANYLLRGIALTAGRHNVEMYYEPPTVTTGLVISFISLLLICFLRFYGRRS